MLAKKRLDSEAFAVPTMSEPSEPSRRRARRTNSVAHLTGTSPSVRLQRPIVSIIRHCSWRGRTFKRLGYPWIDRHVDGNHGARKPSFMPETCPSRPRSPLRKDHGSRIHSLSLASPPSDNPSHLCSLIIPLRSGDTRRTRNGLHNFLAHWATSSYWTIYRGIVQVQGTSGVGENSAQSYHTNRVVCLSNLRASTFLNSPLSACSFQASHRSFAARGSLSVYFATVRMSDR